jgi:hypothetical protein
MRRLLFSAVIIGAGWIALTPAMATSLGLPGPNGPNVIATPIEKVGYWKRLYRRYGYPAPYPYYPPAYGYSPPPAAYAYPPPVYDYQPPSPAYAYSPPVYGNQAPPPPAANGNYPSAEGDYDDYPPAEGNYPPADGEYGGSPADGS